MRNEIILRAEPQREYALRFLQNLKIDPAKPFVVSVEPYRKKRSPSQNALHWKRLTEITQAMADYTGYSTEEIHDLMKAKFLKPKIIEINREVVKRYTSKDLSTAEFTEFLNKIEAFAQTELGIILTVPEERYAR